MEFLSQVNNPDDLKKIDISKLPQVCAETRDFLIDTILQNGGHFAGNLGVVELSVALHYVFNSPSDRVIWDVGHQSYIHKILTGRKDLLHDIRNFNGISGFPKMSENIHDAFGTGHSSTAISAACGMGVACKLKGENQRKIIAVVGDGALTGGMSFEALNNLAVENTNVLVIINDNHIGIDPNNGAMDKHLQEIENSPSNFFQNLGLDYSGPMDGHDVLKLVSEFRQLQEKNRPHVLHVRTTKGKGYAAAESQQTQWHSTSKYVKIDTHQNSNTKKWQDAFAENLMAIASTNPKVVGITPAMPSGSGMLKVMQKFPDRFFDVGIAEQHAVTFAAGLASEGLVPFLNIYSTFLQRGYDQLIHDVAMQQLPVIFCIDRAGLVGEDGPTHHGVFDIAFMRTIPDLILTAPRNNNEMGQLMEMAAKAGKPFAIRYPKGNMDADFEDKIVLSDWQQRNPVTLKSGSKTAVLSTGIASNFAMEAISQIDKNISLFHFPFIKPLDVAFVAQVLQNHSAVVTVEDGAVIGGFGEQIKAVAAGKSYTGKIISLGVPDTFVTHGDNKILYEICGYSPSKIAEALLQVHEN